MKIILSENVNQEKKKDIVPLIMDTVFSICREDKKFKNEGDIKTINSELKQEQQILKKQLGLIQQSDQVKATLTEKIKALDDDSFRIKVQVLESLGSEL